MSPTIPRELELVIDQPLTAAPDEQRALDHYPALADFRARLGNSPLMTVPGPPGGARVMAKCEFTNPFGSVKDRPAYAMLCAAIAAHDPASGPLKVLDFSGGNFALALAGLGGLTGIPTRLAIPDSTAPSIRGRLSEAHVRLDLVPAEQFLYGIIRRALDIAAADPSWTMLHQMRNMANVAVHEFGTGPEIIRQLSGERPTCLVAAIGTGGTLAGVGRAFRKRYGDDIAYVGVTPREFPFGTDDPPRKGEKFAGAGGLGYGLQQPFVEKLAPGTAHRCVPYRDALAAMARFRKETDIRIGASSAANWLTACDVAAALTPKDVVVTLFADAGMPEEWERIDRSGF